MTATPEDPSTDAPSPRPRRRALRIAALTAAAGLAVTVGLGWWAYARLDGNLRTDTATERALAEQAALRPKSSGDAENILVMGSDYRPELGSARSDTVLLVHLAGDGKRLQVVSVPRDMMVPIPSCPRAGAAASRAQYAQFNWAFDLGGAACTIRTFEDLTGIRVDHHLVVGFEGFSRIVDAVGGVEVDLPRAERDPNVGLDLSAGPHLLQGADALAYVRAREYVGDGSDTNRMSRQQAFLGQLSAKLRSSGTLFNPARLYPVLDAVTSSITADSGLDSLGKLYDLVARLRAVPEGQVDYRTVPRKPYTADPDRDVPDEPAASQLFRSLREDRSPPPDPAKG
ncbi:LCP family protein [Streptomyces sp. NRRL B-24484]|uniref:LCP family protein n=1 Tax=Streptomyces sp. NRRL B-24484 TaxID=1463833 RepID=UPI000694471E|nr:LCP family protein [Streptomyces sp. NRRL B-24484]